jgi:hypothetical protein
MHEKQKKDESKAALDREKREAKTYKSGLNMEDVVDDDKEQGDGKPRKKPADNRDALSVKGKDIRLPKACIACCRIRPTLQGMHPRTLLPQ